MIENKILRDLDVHCRVAAIEFLNLSRRLREKEVTPWVLEEEQFRLRHRIEAVNGAIDDMKNEIKAGRFNRQEVLDVVPLLESNVNTAKRALEQIKDELDEAAQGGPGNSISEGDK